MMFPVFDLHCDTAFEMLGKSFDNNLSLHTNQLHIDLNRAKKLPAYTQCFACFTSDHNTLPIPISAEELFRRELDTIQAEVLKNDDLISFCTSCCEVEENAAIGRCSAILTIEGPAGFSYDYKQLEPLYQLGFRITTLGWNEKNPLAGSHATGGGLTPRGAEYVKEAQRIGMLIDVSHISDAAFWDIINMTTAPIIASHSNSRSVWNTSRNLTDDMFTAICETNGVVGINLYADFLGENPDFNTVCDHITHFLEIDPTGKHIALGGDLDGCDKLPKGFEGIQDYSKLADHLLRRGLCEETVLDIFWNNAMDVFRYCSPKETHH